MGDLLAVLAVIGALTGIVAVVATGAWVVNMAIICNDRISRREDERRG